MERFTWLTCQARCSAKSPTPKVRATESPRMMVRTGASASAAGIDDGVVPDAVVGVVTGRSTTADAPGAAVLSTTTTAVAHTAAGVTTRARAAERARPDRIGLSSP